MKADVLVDDAPHYAIEFSQNSKPVIVFDQSYNRLINNGYIYRATNWLEVKVHIDKLNECIQK